MRLQDFNFGDTVWGYSLTTWLLAAGTTIALYAFIRLIQKIASRRLLQRREAEEREIYGFLLDCARNLKSFLLLIFALYAGSRFFEIPESVDVWFASITVIALLIQTGFWANIAVSFWSRRYEYLNGGDEPARVTTIRAVSFVSRLILVVLIGLMALDNIPGVDITTLIAGLGVGGIAVALAVQNILGDLFASLSIVLDKPFVVGDFIIVDSYLGTVEDIGLKTTRLKSLTGERIIFSNNDLLKSRVRNYKHMTERRVLFSIGVVYQTPVEVLERIPTFIRQIIEAQGNTRFDRAHFRSYADSFLEFEIVYYVLSPDYTIYMDIQQKINLAIYRRFAEEQIEFAYPTRTLHLQGNWAAGEGTGAGAEIGADTRKSG